MENVVSMTIVNRIDKLNESLLDETVIIEEYPGFGDSGEQITSLAKVEDHKDKGIFKDDTVKGNDVGVIADQGMMSELATLVLLLTGPRIRCEQTLDSIVSGTVGRR
jgi:hypothetical protein